MIAYNSAPVSVQRSLLADIDQEYGNLAMPDLRSNDLQNKSLLNMLAEGINYNEIGFYIGDCIARLILSRKESGF